MSAAGDATSAAADWAPVIAVVVPLVVTGFCGVVTWVFARCMPRVIAAYEQISGVQLDASQQAAIYRAADTAASLIKAQITQGVMHLAHGTDPTHPTIAEHAAAAIARVPEAAAGQGVTQVSMQQIIAGKVAEDASYLPLKPPSDGVAAQPPPGMNSGPPSDHNDQPGSMAGAAMNALLSTQRTVT